MKSKILKRGKPRRKLSMRTSRRRGSKVASRRGRRTMRALDTPPSEVFRYPSGRLRRERWDSSVLDERLEADLPGIIDYYDNEVNSPQIMTWLNSEYKIDRKYQSVPGYVEYYPYGGVKEEVWYELGKRGRRGDLPSKIEYYENGIVSVEEYMEGDFFVRDDDKPALVRYHENGNLQEEIWFLDGVEGRDDVREPSRLEFDEEGGLVSETWLGGEEMWNYLMENDLPAFKEYYEIELGDIPVVSRKIWMKDDGFYHRENDKPALVDYYFDGGVAVEEWYIENEPSRENDKPVRVEYYENGAVKQEEWKNLMGDLHRENGKPALIRYSQSGNVISEEFYENGQVIFKDELTRNVSLFYQSCQMNLENTVSRSELSPEDMEKVIGYLLDPIVYLDGSLIRDVLQMYETVPKQIMDKNATFRDLIFTEAHTSFLTSSVSLSPKFIDARLLVTQWVTWYFQNTRREAKELIDRLRNNLTNIRDNLPNVYKPELYADLFEAFFFGEKTVNELSSPYDSNPFRELNFYLHAGDEYGFANRIVDKMMTGLRNFNYLYEWVDEKKREGDTTSLQRAREMCKLGRSGEGWMCGDGLFDTIPTLLSEIEGNIEWKKLDDDEETNKLLNMWMIAPLLLSKTGKTKIDFPEFPNPEFETLIQDLLWANKTFRTKWGYNNRDTFEAAFLPGGALERYRDRSSIDIMESIYDTLPDHA